MIVAVAEVSLGDRLVELLQACAIHSLGLLDVCRDSRYAYSIVSRTRPRSTALNIREGPVLPPLVLRTETVAPGCQMATQENSRVGVRDAGTGIAGV